ncbi:MAG: P-type conjugative transfer protein TrbG [Hyphomicrobiales bacterium]|jgi:type IV secretion system protein VirB9
MRKTLIALAAPVVLTACAHQDLPPEISYDTDDFSAAALTAEPSLPVEIVALPEPVPMPGQLMPVPEEWEPPVDDRDPQTRVDAANSAAAVEPTGEGYVNAVQVYPYTEGALYQLYTMPEMVSNITLQAGEEIVAVSAGDTVRWVIGDTVSGDRAHVLVKPIAEGLRTNLVIITDRRAYHLELRSTPETYMASVSWHYPRDALLALQQRNAEAIDAADQVIDEGLRLEQLRFRYEITGDTPPWRPVRVFDDMHKVYIQFPLRLDQGEAPPLFVVGANGENQLVNYRVRRNYYIVDHLFAAAELRLGEDPQQVVRITRTDGTAQRHRQQTVFSGLWENDR